jgi:hypothetical protein
MKLKKLNRKLNLLKEKLADKPKSKSLNKKFNELLTTKKQTVSERNVGTDTSALSVKLLTNHLDKKTGTHTIKFVVSSGFVNVNGIKDSFSVNFLLSDNINFTGNANKQISKNFTWNNNTKEGSLHVEKVVGNSLIVILTLTKQELHKDGFQPGDILHVKAVQTEPAGVSNRVMFKLKKPAEPKK